MKTLHKRLNALSQSCDSLHLLNIVPKFLHSLLLKRKIDTVLILVHYNMSCNISRCTRQKESYERGVLNVR